MPENACRYFYRCEGCGETLKPRDGECCLFCSYGTVECPPKQAEAKPESQGDADRCQGCPREPHSAPSVRLWRAAVAHGNTQRKVLRTGRLHQQSSAQPYSTAPMPRRTGR